MFTLLHALIFAADNFNSFKVQSVNLSHLYKQLPTYCRERTFRLLFDSEIDLIWADIFRTSLSSSDPGDLQ